MLSCLGCFQRNQRKKQALAETKANFSKLVEENRRLLKEREANQKESYEVTEYLRKELLIKTERLLGIDEKIKEVGLVQGHLETPNGAA